MEYVKIIRDSEARIKFLKGQFVMQIEHFHQFVVNELVLEIVDFLLPENKDVWTNIGYTAPMHFTDYVSVRIYKGGAVKEFADNRMEYERMLNHLGFERDWYSEWRNNIDSIGN